jgi:hypothetical protein
LGAGDRPEVAPARSLGEYFHEALTEALRNQSIRTSELTEFYLVHLLEEFAHSGIVEEPLGVRLAEVMVEPPEERKRALKQIGDTSLYVSGFFGESLEHRSVALDYYISLGGNAYAALATLIHMSRHSEVLGGVYDELSDKFPRLVDVLAEVSERSAVASDRSVLHLYERWVRTRRDWVKRLLAQKGVFPPQGRGSQ